MANDTCGSNHTAAAQRMMKAYRALELWERWFVESGDPMAHSGECFFCKALLCNRQNHAPDCIYLAARELIEQV